VGASTTDHAAELVDMYGRSQGVVHLPTLLADPGLSRATFDGSARVVLSTLDGEVMTLYHPDRSSFESSGAISSTYMRYVAVELGDGSVVPATLEVTVHEG